MTECREIVSVAADHPALAGHFPDNPIVPGVLLLDLALTAIARRRPVSLVAIETVKFLGLLRPGELCTIVWDQPSIHTGQQLVTFRCLTATALVAEGSLWL